MKLPVVALALSLSGCAAAEHAILGLAPDQQWVAKPRPKVRVAKLPASNPTSIHDKAPELALPPWNVPLPRPSRVLQYALPPPLLFKTASPAVYAVLGQATALATSQGSAVAVSSKEAITNCHVVARSKTITLANATTRLRAEVIAADRKTDRCYLRVLDGELEPVPGFRDYASLSVGEVVFTIGSPEGLINTLGDGLLSGLRRSEEGVEYVQITAPVSPGSSGGGVFDDRGNLVGITTFTIRDAQNLNFAISASLFWR
jgi:S1-C subfamily serine protease